MFPGVFSILTSMEKETSIIMSGTLWHSHYDIHYSMEACMHRLYGNIYFIASVEIHSGAAV